MEKSQNYPQRIAGLSRDFGIPADYAASRRLTLQIEAQIETLELVGLSPEQREVRLAPDAAAAWRLMQAAATVDGIVLLPLSGFRSVARQTEIIRDKLAAGRQIADILRLIAAPGYSEHHTGCALDIGCPEEHSLEEEFGLTTAYRWLESHAGGFGFSLSFPRNNPHGIAYEPWHWLWRAP